MKAPACEMCGRPMRRAWTGKTHIAWLCGDTHDALKAERERALEAVHGAFDPAHLRIVQVAR